ncbi:MAG: DUF167 domain-containing protein [Syntrophomonadaceae bacterium]|nr:DUF167 domain-containing protein [Syntrophomonadaceae bacterium]
MSLNISEYGGGVRFSVRVQPRASQSCACGVQGESLKIKLTAPPVDGAANSALIAFLAETLHIAKGNVSIVQGESGRNKVVQVKGITKEQFEQRFNIKI